MLPVHGGVRPSGQRAPPFLHNIHPVDQGSRSLARNSAAAEFDPELLNAHLALGRSPRSQTFPFLPNSPPVVQGSPSRNSVSAEFDQALRNARLALERSPRSHTFPFPYPTVAERSSSRHASVEAESDPADALVNAHLALGRSPRSQTFPVAERSSRRYTSVEEEFDPALVNAHLALERLPRSQTFPAAEQSSRRYTSVEAEFDLSLVNAHLGLERSPRPQSYPSYNASVGEGSHRRDSSVEAEVNHLFYDPPKTERSPRPDSSVAAEVDSLLYDPTKTERSPRPDSSVAAEFNPPLFQAPPALEGDYLHQVEARVLLQIDPAYTPPPAGPSPRPQTKDQEESLSSSYSAPSTIAREDPVRYVRIRFHHQRMAGMNQTSALNRIGKLTPTSMTTSH